MANELEPSQGDLDPERAWVGGGLSPERQAVGKNPSLSHGEQEWWGSTHHVVCG
jgi:hypothetical protein